MTDEEIGKLVQAVYDMKGEEDCCPGQRGWFVDATGLTGKDVIPCHVCNAGGTKAVPERCEGCGEFELDCWCDGEKVVGSR